MSTNLTSIDINSMKLPDLYRIVEEVKTTKTPRILKRDNETVAMLMPVGAKGISKKKQTRSQKNYKRFLAAAGSLKGLIDAEQLKKDIYESRKIITRPAISL